MNSIQNPILRGFNPDPSFLRVGDDYYIATSTFEWFSGVAIHHSRDLVHWHLTSYALTRRSQMDLAGITDSSGIWAPNLTYRDGLFYLVYTIVRSRTGSFKDLHNYVITAPDVHGPWSDPVYLNASGFDPALIHDDGRTWMINLQWDFRQNHSGFFGIIQQEYDIEQQKLVGPIYTLLEKQGLIEGSNLYKVGDYYHLILAKGGTGWLHSISLARSKHINGPYEVDSKPYILSARDNEALPLQKAGHGSIVQTPSGKWYVAYLCGRPVGEGENRRCILGRETSLQEVTWSDDGWLRLASGGTDPETTVAAPQGFDPHPWPNRPERDDFDVENLSIDWMSLRVPIEESWASLKERPGWLRLRGRESLRSLYEQSLVAKRIEELHATAETCLEFSPEHFTQMAGLVCYYDTRGNYYLRVTIDDNGRKVLGIVLTDDGVYDELEISQITIDDWQKIYLRANINAADLQFRASPNGQDWQPIGPILDMSKLSDDYNTGPLRFTGTMVGLCAQDFRGTRLTADFDYFKLSYPE